MIIKNYCEVDSELSDLLSKCFGRLFRITCHRRKSKLFTLAHTGEIIKSSLHHNNFPVKNRVAIEK